MDTPEAPISDLTGIQDLTHLTTLHVMGNEGGRIESLEPLRDMTTLRNLTLQGEYIQDITPLQELIQLKQLNVSSNRIKSLEPLRDLTALAELDVSGNQITDFRPVVNLPAVTSGNPADFQATAQTIFSQVVKQTGETSGLDVYTPDGEKLPVQEVAPQGEKENETTVKWLQPGKQRISYQKEASNIAVFLMQDVERTTVASKKKRSMGWCD